MSNTKTVGEISEAMITAYLLRCGYAVLKPYGDNQRYDLVIEVSGSFSRVQCKTACLSKDKSCLRFSSCSSQTHRGGKKQNYRGQIEYFAVYSPDLGKVYLVPPEQAGKVSTTLRLTPAKNNNKVLVKLAENYELA